MAKLLEVGVMNSFSPTMPLRVPFNQRKDLLSHVLFSFKLNMDQKVYRRISDNIYRTLQEHKDASRVLAKIKFEKGENLFERFHHTNKDQTSFSKNVFPLN